MKKYAILIGLVCFIMTSAAQPVTNKVNVFLGSSGDHGQLSPAASYPFSMLSIGPQTYPHGHTGYEHKAKEFIGFIHNRFEGVGCEGSGGNILITPFMEGTKLIKKKEEARPGYYAVSFTNGITAEMTVCNKSGIERYHFPTGRCGFRIDLSHTLANPFVNEHHVINGRQVSGWIESGTTCGAGIYKIFYAISFDEGVVLSEKAPHIIEASLAAGEATIRIGLSSVSEAWAIRAIDKRSFETVRQQSVTAWDEALSHIRVSGDPKEEKLFYSLLYRTLQSPYNISEPDGTYKAIDGSIQHSDQPMYNGWTIWDNYKTQLPLLSIVQQQEYTGVITSIANLYKHGKKSWATLTEPSNTVRTEHAIVVLLDAYRKGYKVDFESILDSLIHEVDKLGYDHPDKALESSYDTWALSEILTILHKDSLSDVYLKKALQYKAYWRKDFKDLSKEDVDDIPARNMYQGTIWQYRWMVLFDVKGLMNLCGGEDQYISQLDTFFGNDYYNAANEPDIQVPYMYSGTSQPWKSQAIIHKFAHDTVIQYYYNDNSRGIDPFIDRVYKNQPDAYIRTMDDDGGAMSSWYILAACGLSPACVGWPVWYLQVPLFRTVILNPNTKQKFTIQVNNFSNQNIYVHDANLNGRPLDRNWLTHEELTKGGELIITAASKPNTSFGIKHLWITSIEPVQK